MKKNRFLAPMLLAMVSAVLMSAPAFAEPEDVQPETKMKVTVPYVLPVDVDREGNVTVSGVAKIENNGDKSIKIDEIEIIPAAGWQLCDWDTDFTREQVNSKKFGFSINDTPVGKTGRVPAVGYDVLEPGNSAPVNYLAKLATQSQELNMSVATVSFTFSIAGADDPVMLQVARPPLKNEYYEGENFDTAGMLVQVQLYDDSVEDVAEYEVVGGEALAAGTDHVTLNYVKNDIPVSVDVPIIVHKLTMVGISAETDGHVYTDFDAFDANGVTVYGHFQSPDGRYIKREITDWAPSSGTVQYGDTHMGISCTSDGEVFETSVPITVAAARLDRAELQLGNTQQRDGTVLDIRNSQVTLYITDSRGMQQTRVLGMDKLTVAGETLHEGDRYGTVTFDYGRMQTASAQIEVEAPRLDKLYIASAPYKTEYWESDTFESTGLALTGDYTLFGEYLESLDVTEFRVTDTEPLVYGMDSVRVIETMSGTEKYVDVPVMVKEDYVHGIEVTRDPQHTAYVAGADFDPTGMQVTAFYASGRVKDVTEYVRFENNRNLNSNQTAVTITYEDKGITVRASAMITVREPQLTGLIVTSAPSAQEVGSIPSIENTIFVANYEDGSFRNLSSANVVIESGDEVVTEQGARVLVSYSEHGRGRVSTWVIIEAIPVAAPETTPTGTLTAIDQAVTGAQLTTAVTPTSETPQEPEGESQSATAGGEVTGADNIDAEGSATQG